MKIHKGKPSETGNVVRQYLKEKENTEVVPEPPKPLAKEELKRQLTVHKEPPPNLNADEAVAWAQTRLKELAPLAAQIIEHELRESWGKDQGAAARDLLDRVGVTKRQEQQTASAPLVVVKVNAGRPSMPWMKRDDDEE